jgi:hypothetical protein
MGRLMGIEPTNVGATIRCVNHFATTAIIILSTLAGMEGIEPSLTVLETAVLPLNYIPIKFKWWRETVSNRRTRREQIYSLPRLATSLSLQKFKWWRLTGSNRRPSACKADALPTELNLRKKLVTCTGFEPVYACVKGMCVNRFTNRPFVNGAPTRT